MSNNKRIAANVFVSGLGQDLCNPFFDSEGTLYIIRQNIGAILSVDKVGNTLPYVNTGGQPSAAMFSDDNILYVADFAHAAILAYSTDGQQETVVAVYEDKPLRGPNGISIVDGDIFFSDSGSFGETGLHSPQGSVFAITNSPSGQILKPLSLSNLAYPSGIAVTHDRKFIYVAETMKNRVLRYFQQPHGVWHGSVFYQLSGGVGPICLTLDDEGHLYIGHYEVRDSGNEGNVHVVTNAGKLIRTITTPGAEISGIALWENTLYITERSHGAILKADL